MRSNISVIIITNNRPLDAKAAVISTLSQSVKPLEVVLIDNASSPAIGFVDEINSPDLRLFRLEKLIGLSEARNFGIKVARGDYIAFIDDDCLPTNVWLEEICKGIERGFEILGGPLEPKFMATPPDWLEGSEHIWWGVGVGNGKTGEIWGGNMVFKKDVFKKIGLFNPEIGRQKGKLLGYEDADLINRGKRCYSVLFVPGALVLHRVTAKRMTIGYVIRWSFYWGKTEKLVSGWRPFETCYELVLAMIMSMNPSEISKKLFRVKRMSWMAELFGRLF